MSEADTYDPYRGVGGVVRRLWRDLPIWYLPCQAISILYSEINGFDQPRLDLVITAVFPIGWFLACRISYWRQQPALDLLRRFVILVFALAAVIAVVAAILPPMVLEPEVVYKITEFGSLALAVVMAAHCLKNRGKDVFLCLFVIGLVYGIVLENSGIWLGFFDERGYDIYVPGLPAPLFTMLGWSVCIYISYWVTEHLASSLDWRVKTLIGTAIAISLDLQIDPAAAAFDWWRWRDVLEPDIFGVPRINFVAWFSAVAPFFAAYYRIQSSPQLSSSRKTAKLAKSLPLILAVAATSVLVLTALLCGYNSPAMNLFKDAARKVFAPLAN